MALVLLDFGITDRTGDVVPTVEVKVETNGRVLLPADVRRKLGVQPGDTLLLDVTDDGILLWTREMAARGLRDLVSRSVPAKTSLVDELSRMRRVEEATLDIPVASARGRRKRD
jgi:AbrB family looped-hinge helix DNA binding protein